MIGDPDAARAAMVCCRVACGKQAQQQSDGSAAEFSDGKEDTIVGRPTAKRRHGLAVSRATKRTKRPPTALLMTAS